jgi:predicted RNase H-like nuclease (RuvC/YqgF family)
MEINTDNLKNKITSLESFINEYEEIELNLFNQLKNSVVNWEDGNSIQFDNAIQQEKQETNDILESLKNKKDLYQLIYEKYSELGKKIKCNLGNKNALLRTVDYCYNYATQVINEFNAVDTSFSYSEKSSIEQQKERIVSLRNQLSEIRSSLSEIYNKIEKIEIEIKGKIRELEELNISSFDFGLV